MTPLPDPHVRHSPNLCLMYWGRQDYSEQVLKGSDRPVRTRHSGRILGKVASGPPPDLRDLDLYCSGMRWRRNRRVPLTFARGEIRRVDVAQRVVPPTPPAFAERTVHPVPRLSVQWPPDFLRTFSRCRPKFGGRFLIQSSRYSTVHYETPNARRRYRFDGRSAARQRTGGCIVLYHTA